MLVLTKYVMELSVNLVGRVLLDMGQDVRVDIKGYGDVAVTHYR